ncbi:MAG: type VI secretion system Vgr family protein, partial [Desulfovibrionaceae bacterium]|nr:type VI secretion system Vgr family protein [Desulfovibrionaceae bacterium]
GQEVIVDFINGDPDYPIITGRVYNDMQMPAWKLPDKKTQSGTQTRWSKGGGGKSMLRFEDQKGIEHLELSNDYGFTQLNMGYLMNQSTEAKRSYGFELRTNEWGAIRADKGLLITTYTQDFKSKITHDNPDGFDDLGEGLQGVQELMAQAKSAVNTMNQVIEAINSLKMGHMTEMGAAIQSMVGKVAAQTSLGQMASALASFASGGSQGAGPEQQMPTDTDPAMPSAKNLQDLSRDIKKPIVSIVSPEGQSLISPKPIVVSSGQTVSVYGTSHTTISSKGQLTNLAQAGMLTHVTEGGQRNTVQSGDIASHAQEGNMNLTAKQNLTLASTDRDASVLAKQVLNLKAQDDSVLVKAGKHIRLEAGESITLAVGPDGAPTAYIKLTSEGDVVIYGKQNGVIQFKEKLDQFGKPINLNCE